MFFYFYKEKSHSKERNKPRIYRRRERKVFMEGQQEFVVVGCLKWKDKSVNLFSIC